jgi:hypothetical protein
MDFVERLFNMSPDAGSGALEAACILAILMVFAALLVRRRVAQWRGHGGRGES